MKDTFDGNYVYNKMQSQKQTFPLASFTINQILDYVAEHCFIDNHRLRYKTDWMKSKDIWAGFGRKPNNTLVGWYITFNAKYLKQNVETNKISKKVVWNNYSNPPYICYYDGETYYSKQMDLLRSASATDRLNRADFDVKIDSDDFIRMEDYELHGKYFNISHNRVFKDWASMQFVQDMAHFRIDKDLINPRHLGLINWPYEKPQGLI
jgi:hypothetical protein